MSTIAEHPIDSLIIVPFAFQRRKLTSTEQATFLATGQLPEGVGYDPPHVEAEVIEPGDGSTATPTEIFKDGTGAYHTKVIGSKAGRWRARAKSKDVDGSTLIATAPHVFRIIPFG